MYYFLVKYIYIYINTNLYKIIIIGDSGVGKTCLLNRYIYENFDENTTCTVGAAYFTKKIKLDSDNIIEIQFWDTAGQERYKACVPFFMRNCKSIILVYDISCPNLENLSGWINFIKDKSKEDKYDNVYLIGNKIDLVKEIPEKTIEEISKRCENFIREDNIFVTSAKNGKNINIIFNKILSNVKKDTPIYNTEEANILNNGIVSLDEDAELSSTVGIKSILTSCCYKN